MTSFYMTNNIKKPVSATLDCNIYVYLLNIYIVVLTRKYLPRSIPTELSSN